MHILTAEARTHYLEKYPIDDFFSFDINPYLEVRQFDKGSLPGRLLSRHRVLHDRRKGEALYDIKMGRYLLLNT